MNKPIHWITRTALFVALIIAVQFVTSTFVPPPATTFVAGSLVNLLLILAVMTSGLSTGITAALLSPVFAKLIGIGPLWQLIPFIMLGNIALVIVWHIVGNLKNLQPIASHVIAAVLAAVAKFVVLYLGIVKFAIPTLLSLPAPQAATISGMFSVPQLITAGIGGAAAVIIYPLIENALGKSKR